MIKKNNYFLDNGKLQNKEQDFLEYT